MNYLSQSSKELLQKICTDFCSLAVYRPPTYQQRFSQAYIFNFFKGNYNYSLNNYNEIFKFILTNKKEEWELSELPEPPKKRFRGDTQMIQSPDKSYTWGQNYTHNLAQHRQPKLSNDGLNILNSGKLYDTIPQSKSVVKVNGGRIAKKKKYDRIGKARTAPHIYKWYTHESNKDECYYCGIMMTEHNRSRDHVNPKLKGKDNLIWACVECNGLKSNYSLEVWLEILKNKLTSFGTVESPSKKYYERIIESVSYMIETKLDADLMNDSENVKASSIIKHIHRAINEKKRKQ